METRYLGHRRGSRNAWPPPVRAGATKNPGPSLCPYPPDCLDGGFSETGLPALGVLANAADQRGHSKRAQATIPGPSLTLFALTTASGTATTDAAASTVATDAGSSATAAVESERRSRHR